MEHLQKIKTVPSLHHLPFPHPKHQHPLKRNRLAGAFHAKALTRMRCLDLTIAGDEVTFLNHFFDADVNIRKRDAKAVMEFFEFFRLADFIAVDAV